MFMLLGKSFIVHKYLETTLQVILSYAKLINEKMREKLVKN